MKKTFHLILTLAFLIGGTAAFAQKAKKANFPEGSITYEMKFDGTGQMKELGALLNNFQIVMSFKDQLSRTDISIMGGMIAKIMFLTDAGAKTGSLIYDVPVISDKGLVRMDSSMQAASASADVTKSAEESGAIKYVKGKKKKIAGYKCSTAVMDLMGQSMKIYYTDAIRPAAMPQGFQNLKGFPLGMEADIMGMKISFFAKEIKKGNIDAADFNEPSGYPELSMDEFKKKMEGVTKQGGIGM